MTAYQVPPAMLIKKIRQSKKPLTGIQANFDNQRCPVFHDIVSASKIKVSVGTQADLSLINLLPSECPDRQD